MKITIPPKNLLDPKLRAFVAKQQYIEALRYYRDTYQASRAEASEAIDAVRAQLDFEREQNISPVTSELWVKAPTAPQKTKEFVPPLDEVSPDDDEDNEESQETETSRTSLNTEQYTEDDENIDENPNESPYAIHIPTEIIEEEEEEERINTGPDGEEDLIFDDEDQVNDKDEIDERETKESTTHQEENISGSTPQETAEEPPQPPKPTPLVIHATPLPETPISIPGASSTPDALDIPLWESLPASLRRELSSLSLEEAIRAYWREANCSLLEAKAHVSFWFSPHIK